MDATLGFGGGDALDAVDTAFEFELAVGAVADDAEDDFFEAASVVEIFGLELDFEIVRFGVAGVQPKEFGCEEAGFVATSAGADFDDGGLIVGRVARDEEFGELGLGCGEVGFEVGNEVGEGRVGRSIG